MNTRRRSTLTPQAFIIQWEAAETVLTRVKHSCYKTHLLYRKRYLISRDRLVYYDVPIIVLSSVNSVFIAGAKNFMPINIVEVTTCMLALTVGIIQALRTFFKVDENRENCLVTYKDLFRLFCELSIMLDQPRETRGVDPQKWMADKNAEYKEIMNKAIVLEDNKSQNNPIYEDTHAYNPERVHIRQTENRSILNMFSRSPSPSRSGEGDIGLPIDSSDSSEELRELTERVTDVIREEGTAIMPPIDETDDLEQQGLSVD